MKPLIYAVDDEEAIRELYDCAVSNAEMICSSFENADELFSAVRTKLPDLIILDIMLDGMNGYEILQRLKNDTKTAGISVIIVSAKDDEISKVKGLYSGADDYLSKPFGIMELIARIKANLRKNKQIKPAAYKDISIDGNKHQIFVNGAVLPLTLKKYNLLKELVENAESVLNRDDLLNKIWGYGFQGETRTLDIHIAELRKALSAAGSETEIITVRGIGYSLK
jgi:two-component system alkaline phosphatase synthesis response regulator PhoP